MLRSDITPSPLPWEPQGGLSGPPSPFLLYDTDFSVIEKVEEIIYWIIEETIIHGYFIR